MILGSCHGLILFNINENIYLWNPATLFCIKLFELNRLHDHCIKVLELNRLYDHFNIRGGLCFDSSMNIYKAVLIMRYQGRVDVDEFVIIASLEDKTMEGTRIPL